APESSEHQDDALYILQHRAEPQQFVVRMRGDDDRVAQEGGSRPVTPHAIAGGAVRRRGRRKAAPSVCERHGWHLHLSPVSSAFDGEVTWTALDPDRLHSPIRASGPTTRPM